MPPFCKNHKFVIILSVKPKNFFQCGQELIKTVEYFSVLPKNFFQCGQELIKTVEYFSVLGGFNVGT